MNEQNVSVSSVAVRYGLLVGLISVIYSFILAMMDQVANRSLGSISYLFLIVGMVLAMKYFKSHNEGYMGYSQGLGIGTLMSLVSGLIASIFMFIYSKFIDPTMMDRMMEMQRIEMEKKGMDDEKIEQALEMTSKFTSPEMLVIFGTIGFVIIGFIIALIVSAIMKNNQPEFE